MAKIIPKNIDEYLQQKINSLPTAAGLIILLNPDLLLSLSSVFIDNKGKKWQIFFYTDNDLIFRKEYVKASNKNIVVVNEKNLNFIGDILSKADEVFDFSLKNILSDIIILESNWPEVIYDFQEEILQNLKGFLDIYKELRKNLTQNQLLNKRHINIMLLCLKYKSIPVSYFFKELTDIKKILLDYINLIFLNKIQNEDWQILKNIFTEANYINKEEILPFLKISANDIALYLYLKNITQRYELQNDETILKGLGLVNFNLENSNNHIQYLINNLSEECWSEIIFSAEENLTQNSLEKVLNKLNINDLSEIASAMKSEKLPLFLLCLIYKFLQKLIENKKLNKDDIGGVGNVNLNKLYKTTYFKPASDLAKAIQKLEFILNVLDKQFNPKDNLKDLLNFYVENKVYLLEFYTANLYRTFDKVENQEFKKDLLALITKIKVEVNNYLENINQNLVNIISKNTAQFLKSPLLSINLIKNLVKDFIPYKNKKLWILIFDGMRLDTYNEIIKPKLQEQFNMEEEGFYFCPLPSITDIARISLLAQKLPSEWVDYHSNYTFDPNVLTAKGLLLTKDERKTNLNIVSASETDYGQQKLNFSDTIYNVLIYNLSDDWIHSFRNDISELNFAIKDAFEKNILPDIFMRVAEDDLIILTSDHGFIELSRERENVAEILSNIDYNSKITYRYLKNIESKFGVKIQYDDKNYYTLGLGNKYFCKDRLSFTRYSHGGISMQEMVIPGVILKKIVKQIIQLELEIPEIEEVIEDKEKTICFIVKNTGNQPTNFELKITYAETEKIHNKKITASKSEENEFCFVPSLKSNLINVELSYKNLENKILNEFKRISFKVIESKEKIEIDTSALDKFDDL